MMAVSKVGLLRSSSEDSFEHIDPDFDNSYYPSELFGVAIADYIPLEKDEILIRKGDKLIIAEQSLDQKDFIVVNTRTQSQGKVPTNFVKIVADETSMEDTGEIVHVTKSDLQRPTFLGRLDSNKGSSLNHGHPSLQNKGVSLDDGDDDSVSSLDHGIRRRPMNLEDEETESDLDQSVSGRLIPGKKAGKMGIVRRKGVSKNKGSPYRSSGSSHEDEGSPVRVAGGSGRGQHKVLEQRRNDLETGSTV